MRRQRRVFISKDSDIDEKQSANMSNISLNESNAGDNVLKMERLSGFGIHGIRMENTIEAKVETGDTLQALALRFHCTVADIKRINKIDKDNEIFARKLVKIPVTPHSVLLETLPMVHTSGSNSPIQCNSTDNTIIRNPLEDAKIEFGEKLIVASVNASSSSNQSEHTLNNDILNSKLLKKQTVYSEKEADHTNANDSTALLDDILNDDFADTHVRPIRGPSSFNALHWSGSDGDMTWVCLFVVILALCFVIPLIIVIFWTHPHNMTITTGDSSSSSGGTNMANTN